MMASRTERSTYLARAAITDEELLEYRTNGYVLVRSMLDDEETSLLGHAAREDRILDQHSFARRDGEGGTVRLSLWNHPTDTIYGMLARSESIVNSAEKLLDGEVYHYHSKMIMKDAKVGGAWTWHQDYGYWFRCLPVCSSPSTVPPGRTDVCRLSGALTN
jgi:ectoine hydroxylase